MKYNATISHANTFNKVNLFIRSVPVIATFGSLSNDDGDGYENVTKREIRYFHVVVVQRRQRNEQKSVMHVQSCCFANFNLLLFCRPR